MDLRIFVEPQQGATYDEQLACALAAERAGFDAFFRSDHYLSMAGTHGPGPTDSWVTLAGLARETSTIRLGTMVTSATFRLPGVLAISVAQVDAMSGGRVELGLGTGWFAAEHRAYGIPFPERRFGLLEEQLEVITGMWATPADGVFSYAGAHYELEDSPALPKPVQDPLPIIVGGGGARRTPALAARFAAEFNVPFLGETAMRERFDGVRRACEAIDRDPDSIAYSVALGTAVGRTEAEWTERVRRRGADPATFLDDGIGGLPQQAVDKLGRLAELGCDRVYLQTEFVQDVDQVELLGAEVLPHVA
jgi:F420-dependent oxidoreductase-like protein